jgi:hypothetical protein
MKYTYKVQGGIRMTLASLGLDWPSSAGSSAAGSSVSIVAEPPPPPPPSTTTWCCTMSEKGVRLAQNMQFGPCIPVACENTARKGWGVFPTCAAVADRRVATTRIPSAEHSLATSTPMPPSPTMPTVLPATSRGWYPP